jgi:hypothetical protein
MEINSEEINENLMKHQHNVIGWDNGNLANSLLQWIKQLVEEFKLKCPLPALRLESLHMNCKGHFCFGRNGFGIQNEVALNERYINQGVVDFDAIGTILHELIHCEQQTLGTDCTSAKNRNYHNADFIDRAKSFGLLVDHKGEQKYASPPTQFSELLAKYGVPMPVSNNSTPIKVEPKASLIGKSKQKLWVCSCKPKPVKVRVAISDFQAQPLKC